MAYEDELNGAFIRWEQSGFKNIRDWATQDKKGRTVRSWSGTLKNFGSQLEEARAIVENAKGTKRIDTLNEYIKQANTLGFSSGKDYALGNLNEQIRIKEGEVTELKNTIKTTRSFSELNKSIDDLRTLHPKSLGGILSGQTRFRGSKKEEEQVARAISSLDRDFG